MWPALSSWVLLHTVPRLTRSWDSTCLSSRPFGRSPWPTTYRSGIISSLQSPLNIPPKLGKMAGTWQALQPQLWIAFRFRIILEFQGQEYCLYWSDPKRIEHSNSTNSSLLYTFKDVLRIEWPWYWHQLRALIQACGCDLLRWCYKRASQLHYQGSTRYQESKTESKQVSAKTSHDFQHDRVYVGSTMITFHELWQMPRKIIEMRQ